MKIQIISDLHQEFGVSELSFLNADMVILAGDINVGVKGVEWIKSEIRNIPVVYVLGNHEYYKGSYPKTLYKIKEAAKNSNIHDLENNTFEIENLCFHGATLWTDFSIFGDPLYYGPLCQSKMNDYRKIRIDPSYAKLRSIDTFMIHQKSMAWLEKSLKENIYKTNIVISHHAPSIHSIQDQFKEDPITAAYASNLEPFINKYQPKYWIHGHLHHPIKYTIGNTQIICNPHGYLDEKYNGFERELIIEL